MSTRRGKTIRLMAWSVPRWTFGPVRIGNWFVRRVSRNKLSRSWVNFANEWGETRLWWHALGLVALERSSSQGHGLIRFVMGGRYHFYQVDGKPSWPVLIRLARALLLLAKREERE